MTCKPHFVRDDDEVDAGFFELINDIKHFDRVFGVECTRGFVEKEELRPRSGCTCNGGALLLSTRERLLL